MLEVGDTLSCVEKSPSPVARYSASRQKSTRGIVGRESVERGCVFLSFVGRQKSTRGIVGRESGEEGCSSLLRVDKSLPVGW